MHAVDVDQRDSVIGQLNPLVGDPVAASAAFSVDVEQVISVVNTVEVISPPPKTPPALPPAPPASPPEKKDTPPPPLWLTLAFVGYVAVFLAALCQVGRMGRMRNAAAAQRAAALLVRRDAEPKLPSLQELPLLGGGE